MESLNLTVVTSGLGALHHLDAPAAGGDAGPQRGRREQKAGRVVARARVLPAQQGHGDERQPGSSRRRARAATVRTAWESRERER